MASEFLAVWEQFKGWFIALGTSGVLFLATNIGLKIRQGGLLKKSMNLAQPTYAKLLDLADKMVVSYGVIDDKVVNVVSKVDNFTENVDKRFNQLEQMYLGLLDLTTIIIALTPSGVELKAQALDHLTKINPNSEALSLLVKDIDNKSKPQKDNPLDNIEVI